MNSRYSFFIILWNVTLAFGVMLLFYSCASTGQLAGGPKDVTPPKLNNLKSSPDRVKNSRPKELTFYFDEFVEVKDAIKQVLVSPPLKYIPKITAKGKRVTVKLDPKEVLRDSTTYTIHFGESIVDFHESNPYSAFKYVFSTGDVIDSMSITGKIKDAVSEKLEDDIVVMLYAKTEDSIIAKEKPLYSTRVSKDGKFIFENIRQGDFKIFALKDLNINQLYDLPSESIAYKDTLVKALWKDSSEILLTMSKPIGKFDVSTINSKAFGKVVVNFNQTAALVDYTVEPTTIKLYPQLVKDSLLLYYGTTDSFKLMLPGFDTVNVKPRKTKDFIKKNPFRRNTTNAVAQFRSIDTLWMEMSHPVESFDTSWIFLEDDLGKIKDFQLTLDQSRKKLSLLYDWVEDITYTWTIDSAALTSIHGVVNDSIGNTFSVLNRDKLCKLVAEIRDLDSTKYYEVQIIRGDIVINSFSIKNDTIAKIVINDLLSDRYDFKVIEDNNQDRKYSPADYWGHTQAEIVKNIKGERLKENKENIVIVSWKTAGLIGGSEPIETKESLKSNPGSKIGPSNQKKQ